MTLDEAIGHAGHVAETCDSQECADEHRQLADWLCDLRMHREGESAEVCDALRELVDAWMGCGTRYHTMSGSCPMFDSDAKDCCKAGEIARELGIEVS